MSEQRKKRTITLTDRAPVRISEDEWPVIAEGNYDDHDGEVRCQANRVTSALMRVRQNSDGRTIVYAVYDYDTLFSNEDSYVIRAGELLEPGVCVVDAIRTVSATIIDSRVASDEVSEHMERVERECIADLPAEEI